MKRADRFADLATEIIRIVHEGIGTDGIASHEQIACLLDSIHEIARRDGERRGIEIGTRAAADTTNVILDLMRPPHARR